MAASSCPVGANPIRPIIFALASAQTVPAALGGLVERILTAQRASPSADTTALEREINARGYRLYALTPAEIQLVEEAKPGMRTVQWRPGAAGAGQPGSAL